MARLRDRRVGAICRLQYDDIIRERATISAIRWRPFKREDEQVVPVSDATCAVLERIIAERPGVGPVPLFPAPKGRGWDW